MNLYKGYPWISSYHDMLNQRAFYLRKKFAKLYYISREDAIFDDAAPARLNENDKAKPIYYIKDR